MQLARIHSSDQLVERLQEYERLRQANQWDAHRDIDWSLDTLDEETRKISTGFALMGNYTEEVGLLIAARLIELIDDLPMRYCLAVQAADEAKHSEVFGRYADQWEHRMQDPGLMPEKPTALLNQLVARKDPLELFILHTMLEGMAMDQFGYLASAFEGDALGQIYRFIRADEARHVAMGMDFLKSALPNLNPEEALPLLETCRADLFSVAQVDENSFKVLAKLTGNSFSELNERFLQRVNARFETLESQIKDVSHENTENRSYN